jgi:ABC-2 type transport system ATP-binding protein
VNRTVNALEIEHLTKRFGAVTAVNDINLTVRAEEIFGFLGPNGAGKTTTIRLITGVLTPDAGTARINGIDIRDHPIEAKLQMGVIPEASTVYGDLSAEQNLHLSGKFYGMSRPLREERIEELLSKMGLWEASPVPSSTGHRSCSLTNPPAVLTFRAAEWSSIPSTR